MTPAHQYSITTVVQVRTLALYYVVGTDPPAVAAGGGAHGGPARGTVFPLPDIHSVLRTNLVCIGLCCHARRCNSCD